MSHLIPFLVLVFFYALRIVFHCFRLLWAAVAAHGPSVVVARSGGCAAVHGFSLRWLLLLGSAGSRARALQQLWLMGLFAPWNVGSSRPGVESVSSVLTGRFLIPGPAGKSHDYLFCTLSSIAKHLQLFSTINSQK